MSVPDSHISAPTHQKATRFPSRRKSVASGVAQLSIKPQLLSPSPERQVAETPDPHHPVHADPKPKLDISNQWAASTCSSMHITNSKSWFKFHTYIERQCAPIRAGNGIVVPEGSGTVDLRAVLSTGADHTIRLTNVAYIPSWPTNVFSVALLYTVNNGWITGHKLFFSNIDGPKEIAKLRATRKGLFLQLVGQEGHCGEVGGVQQFGMERRMT
jgi:hypothetical protein